MIRLSRWWLATSIGALAILAGAAPPTPAQDSVPPGLMTSSSREPAVIRSQLGFASKVGRSVLARLDAEPVQDSLPIDKTLLKTAHDTYALIRAARHGMELAKENAKFPDPIADLAFKRVDAAWNLARTPLDLSSSLGISRQEYLRRSREDLGRALQLVDQALMILP